MVGRVSHNVVAPTKHPGLAGAKLLMISFDDGSPLLLATDAVGAGEGDRVVVATGSHAVGIVAPETPTDAVVVGILD
ncbi:MAG: hypothetical protein L0I76_01675 [Pseudonocardia sp.]|nr:hypothetical protein [Pseudonocardia sp.]